MTIVRTNTSFKPKTLPSYNLTGRVELQIRRKTEDSDGYWSGGVYHSTSVETLIDIEANIQPSKYSDVMKLREGFRTRKSVTLYTNTLVRIMREGDDGYLADEFTWKGDDYEIMYVQDWTEMGVLEHYKAIGVRKELSI